MSDSLRELPFTRSRCVGGVQCVAGCTLHKKVRKRAVKTTGVLIQHSGYGLEPEIEFSDDEEKKNLIELNTVNDICKQNGLNHYLDQSSDDLMSEDDVYEEITIVRRVTKIFRTTITHTSNLINYVTPKPVQKIREKYPYLLWPFLLLLSLLGTSAYLLSRFNSSPFTDSVVEQTLINSDTSSNYALNQISSELKSIKSELESLKRANIEINSKFNNENVDKQDKYVKLNSKVDDLEKVIIDLMRNCCKNETEYISSLIDTRLAAFITAMLTNASIQPLFTPTEAANELKTIINSEIERSNKYIMENIELKLMSTLENFEKQFGNNNNNNNNNNNIDSNNLSIDEIKLIIQSAISIYDADKTGQPDFALEPAGGTVINTRCSETFDPYGIQYRIFGMPVWSSSVSPRAVIQPTISPGECWAFKGSQGYLVIKLSQLIVPTAFSYEHIPKQISRDGNINSAPKEFQVRGLDDETDTKGHLLGNYVYEDNDRPMQHFLVQDPNPTPFQFIELIILSNHGHEEYTCLYRFRVHGKRVNY